MSNKLVLSTYAFSFPVTLTLLHAAFTAAGIELMARAGLFTRRAAPLGDALPVAGAYVASVVLSNWSIQLNTVRGCGQGRGQWTAVEHPAPAGHLPAGHLPARLRHVRKHISDHTRTSTISPRHIAIRSAFTSCARC